VDLLPVVPAEEGRCENPASAMLQVSGIVGRGGQFAELAAGLAARRNPGLSARGI
jgi:hypothetical protein